MPNVNPVDITTISVYMHVKLMMCSRDDETILQYINITSITAIQYNIIHLKKISIYVTGPVKMDQVGTQILTTFFTFVASQPMIC